MTRCSAKTSAWTQCTLPRASVDVPATRRVRARNVAFDLIPHAGDYGGHQPSNLSTHARLTSLPLTSTRPQ